MWFKVDDRFHSNRKPLQIPRRDRLAAIGLWTMAGSWAGDNLTNGYVPDYMIAELGGTPRLAALLAGVGLWDRTRDGYQFHDWCQRNPSRQQVEIDRQTKAESALIGNHRRWHTDRGVTDLRCALCRKEQGVA